MNEIVAKKQLSEEIYEMKILAPLIANERLPGQFLILQVSADYGERIPLTIADANKGEGTVTVIFQTVGRTTHELALLAIGDRLPAIVGPLGRPTHIAPFGRVVGVGGGIGAAPLYPIANAMKEAGNHLTVILGARTQNLLFWEEKFRAIVDDLIICTDDGSAGLKGLVTAPLKELCSATQKPNLVVAIGPPVMMKHCCLTTKPYGVPTVVSLNTIMIDGTGMCGGCRVTVGGKTRFVCVDGPEFDGHEVDFDNMIQRLKTYKVEEDLAHHHCHLAMALAAKEGRLP